MSGASSSTPAGTLLQSMRFVRGLRRFVRTPLDTPGVVPLVTDEHRRRGERFLDSLDHLVWGVDSSPWRRFFDLIGAERGDLRALVRDAGLDDALAALRDRGVYLTTEEANGDVPVRRGSTTFTVRPEELFNPVVVPDFIAGTSGTRSGGIPVAASFAALRRMAVVLHLTTRVWDIDGRPHALWRPALPGSGGLIALLSSSIAGGPPERWFSQLDPAAPGVPTPKRLANGLLPWLAWPTRLPRPAHVPTSDPGPVLAWCHDALDRAGRAALNVYPSSALQLAHAASAAGRPLDGLVLRLVGEPVTAAKAASIRAAGASPVNAYAFTQQGAVATACPHLPDEALHLLDHEVAVTQRTRAKPDGEPVRAYLWTSLSTQARSVWINVENDDYGELHQDPSPCPCLLGQIGMRTRLLMVRGMSKSVTGGVTVPAATVDRLVDVVLPGRFGGGPGDWQLAEGDSPGGSYLEVRAAPRLGDIAGADVVATVLGELRRTDAGVLAAAVWEGPDFIRLVRRAPVAARSGKTLAFEALPSRTRPD